jgi:hypothetical protein
MVKLVHQLLVQTAQNWNCPKLMCWHCQRHSRPGRSVRPAGPCPVGTPSGTAETMFHRVDNPSFVCCAAPRAVHSSSPLAGDCLCSIFLGFGVRSTQPPVSEIEKRKKNSVRSNEINLRHVHRIVEAQPTRNIRIRLPGF